MGEAEKKGKKEVVNKYVYEILPGLYLTSHAKARLKDVQLKHEVRTMLTVMEQPLEVERQLPDITYIHVEMSDEPSLDMLVLMPSFNRTIANALEKGNILVHCMAGVSRSVTAIASFLIGSLYFTANQAVGVIREGRPRAGPNDGFYNQLTVYEKRLRGCSGPMSEHMRVYRTRILEEAALYTNFSLAAEILALDSPPPTVDDNDVFSLFCKECNSFLVNWNDLIGTNDEHTAYQHLVSTGECGFHFTVIGIPSLSYNKEDKTLQCGTCAAVLGEFDAWYGAYCGCGWLVRPGCQIDQKAVVRGRTPSP